MDDVQFATLSDDPRPGLLALPSATRKPRVTVAEPQLDPRALLDEVHALRAEVERLRQELASVRVTSLAAEADQLGRTLLVYVLDVLCALLNPQRGQTIVAHLAESGWRQPKDAQGSVGPLQMSLERPLLERALAGLAGRLSTRYESTLWLPIMHGSNTAVILCLRRAPGDPFSAREQEIGEVLGPLVISALQTGHQLFDLHDDQEALTKLTEAFSARVRLGGGPVAAQARDAERLAMRFQFDEAQCGAIRLAAILHDIGTVDLADDLLHKESALNATEVARIHDHPSFGVEIVRQIPDMAGVLPLIRHHHERWDGAGYLAGLAGGDIPFGARIISVVDAFQAMTSARPYRPARQIDDALHELRLHANSQFDRNVVEEFTRMVREGL